MNSGDESLAMMPHAISALARVRAGSPAHHQHRSILEKNVFHLTCFLKIHAFTDVPHTQALTLDP
jgi:hypothetical protein